MKKILLCLFFFTSLTIYSQALTAIAVTTPTPCNGTSFGQISVMASGGTEPYSYRIMPDLTYQSNNTFTNLSAGTYNIEVKDGNNNFAFVFVTLEDPSPLAATTVVVKPLDCLSNAIVTLTAIGGTAPYTYSKDGFTFVESNIFDNLVAGIYDLRTKDAKDCIVSNIALITQPSSPLLQTITVTDLSCKGSNDGSITVNATGGKTPYTYSINNSTYQSGNYFSNLTAGMHNVIIRDANSCFAVSTTVLISQPDLLSTAIVITDQIVTASATGGTPPYTYSLDGAVYSTVHTFSNLPVGTYDIWAKDANSCVASLDFVINTPAPLINNSNTISLSLAAGQTLADIIVEGENIKWYSTPGILTGKMKPTNKKAGETPLPLTTVLVDNTTYYASQTINGIESLQRLAVTVQLNALATTDFVLGNFKSYPNPVKNNLIIQNTSIIDEIILLSITGKTVLNKKINTLRSEIDLSTFSSGIYFLKVKSEGAEKIVKIIKE